MFQDTKALVCSQARWLFNVVTHIYISKTQVASRATHCITWFCFPNMQHDVSNCTWICFFFLKGLPVALEKHILGFDTGDAVLNEAAQILRLLHIEELRELQTKINEAIVAVQAIIADPKTDHRLGKVGRWTEKSF